VSRLNDLLRQLKEKEPQLAQDLEREAAALADRRAFGLNFERHVPEAVELPGRKIRKGDKVRILPPRGQMPAKSDEKLWRVVSIDRHMATASLAAFGDDNPVDAAIGDLIVVAEFRDPIYPGLVSTGRVERGGDKPFHTVINAENYHALEMLLYTHRGKIDCIYIDPPYNSGTAKDWKYNNDYVEKDDLYRHSKWLAFMERRLALAKELLRPEESVLMCAIDENEVNHLGLLLSQVFPGSKIQMVSILSNPAGASIIDQFSRVDEHLYFVHIGAARPQRTMIDTTPGFSTFVDASGKAKTFVWEPFQRRGGNSRRQDTKAKFFPVYIDEEHGRIVGCGDHLPEGHSRSEVPSPPADCIAQWPIKEDGTEACWQLSAPTFREYLAAGRIKLGRKNRQTGRWGLAFLTKGHMASIESGELEVTGKDPGGALIVQNAEGRTRSQIGKTLWTNRAYSATEHGSTFLRSFIPGRKFSFPKSLYAVEDALRHYLVNKADAIVLDFFAGSGTTTHAVMRLNRQDGGNRQSIAVTNNEVSAEEQQQLRAKSRPGDAEWEALGICEYITKPRISAAVSGLTPDGDLMVGDYRFVDEFPYKEGFLENVEFFSLTYEAPLRVASNREFQRIAPMLWLRAGARGRCIYDISAGWDVADAYGVLADLDRTQEFLKSIASDGVVLAYVVTDEDRLFESIAQQLREHVAPVRLYESYLRNFEIESGRGTL
jgi:adenine-specific DNA-methyltransferase